ncbi:MAG: AAA family ATPase, partial [Methermicoccaceae archaeon]
MSDIDIVKTLTSRTLELTSKRIVGKESVVEVMLITLFSEGHLLIEGVPGVAKTTMAKLFAELTGCSFGRLQFTPDLQPSDITGLYIYNQKEQRFEFHKSPLFSNIILADEINRASPKTQSALLEAMEERYVTSDGNVHKLPTPFMVLATQNPIEVEGTYPLPEAQIDRFAFKVVLDYPSSDEEMDILKLKHS